MSYTDKLEYSKLEIENIVDLAENEAKLFKKDGVKTNQIRNFYSSIAKMRTDYSQDKDYEGIRIELVMLKPKLAYAAGRQMAVKKNFQPFMTKAINGVIEAEDKNDALDKFFALIESIVAYHKFYGDK
jgi:CRISPR-associated protein Csm2